MTIAVTASVTLDDNFVDCILITALDGGYGGSNYWVYNLDDEGTYYDVRIERTPCEDDSTGHRWTKVVLTPTGPDADSYPVKVIGKQALSKAFTEVYNEHKGYVGDYVRRAAADNDPGDIDADAADVIFQIAVLGEVVYG